MNEALARWAPVLSSAWFFLSVGGLILARTRADGATPVVTSSHESRFWRGLAFGLGAALGLYGAVAGFAPGWLNALGRIAALDHDAVRWIGIGLLVAGCAFAFVAQLQMGGAWRIGVPETAPGALVTHGVFRVSRNPIYTGIGAALLGVVLCAPTWGAAVIWLAAAVVGDRYARVEERFLAASFGDAYAAYRQKVRRWE